MRKAFWDDLPRWSRLGNGNKEAINWSESISHIVKGTHYGLELESEIIEHDWIGYNK